MSIPPTSRPRDPDDHVNPAPGSVFLIGIVVIACAVALSQAFEAPDPSAPIETPDAPCHMKPGGHSLC